MDSFEFTKIAAAVLTALLVIVGTKTAIEMNAHGGEEKPGYTIAVAEPEGEGADAAGADAAAAEPAVDFNTILAKANAETGKKVFAKCKGCHAAESGKPATVGPNLWGVVNRDIAHAEGFKYSAGLEGKEGNWTFENLAAFLKAPKAFAPGTKMVFPGFKDPVEKANLIAYLATLADSPVALPTATEPAATPDAAKADEAKPAAEGTDKPAANDEAKPADKDAAKPADKGDAKPADAAK